MGVNKAKKFCNALYGTQKLQVSRRLCSLALPSETPNLSTSLFCRKIQSREREECKHKPSLAKFWPASVKCR